MMVKLTVAVNPQITCMPNRGAWSVQIMDQLRSVAPLTKTPSYLRVRNLCGWFIDFRNWCVQKGRETGCCGCLLRGNLLCKVFYRQSYSLKMRLQGKPVVWAKPNDTIKIETKSDIKRITCTPTLQTCRTSQLFCCCMLYTFVYGHLIIMKYFLQSFS